MGRFILRLVITLCFICYFKMGVIENGKYAVRMS
jgi:hypothetical protein